VTAHDGRADLLHQANVYLDADRPLDAHRLAGQYLLQNPDSGPALTVLALAEHQLGRHADAVASAKRAVTASPHSDHAWRVLALVLAEVKAMQDAIAAAERALAPAPYAWNTHTIAAMVYRETKDPSLRQRAIAEAETAVRLAPHEPDAHVEYGNAVLFTTDRRPTRRARAEATRAYQEALRLDPSHRVARVNLGVVQATSLRFMAASDAYAGVLGESPGDVDTKGNFVAAIGSATSVAALLGFGGLWFSLRFEGPLAMPALVATLIVVCLLVVRFVTRRRSHASTVWRDHPLLIVPLTLSVVGLVSAIALHLLAASPVTVFLVGLPITLVGLVVHYVAVSKLARATTAQASAAALAGLDHNARNQREAFELERRIAEERRRQRGGRPALILFLALLCVEGVLLLDDSPANRGGGALVAFGLCGLAVVYFGGSTLLRARRLKAMDQRRTELLDSTELL